MENKMYQVSTLQALALGYSRAVISVGELLQEGNTGLGTFEDVNGEMIVMDGRCFRADQDGQVTEITHETGVPFAAVAKLYGEQEFMLKDMPDITSVRQELTRNFLSEDRSKGGHVFDVSIREGSVKVDKITRIEINLPKEAAFDTYSLKQDLQEEIKSVE